MFSVQSGRWPAAGERSMRQCLLGVGIGIGVDFEKNIGECVSWHKLLQRHEVVPVKRHARPAPEPTSRYSPADDLTIRRFPSVSLFLCPQRLSVRIITLRET